MSFIKKRPQSSPDETQWNPGENCHQPPDSTAFHPGYVLQDPRLAGKSRFIFP